MPTDPNNPAEPNNPADPGSQATPGDRAEQRTPVHRLEPLTVHRVLGDQPYAAIGRPSLATRDNRAQLVAVAGHLPALQWPGRDASSGRSRHRIGVYERDSAHLRHLVRTRWPVQALAIHPLLPLLAAGTGGWAHEGELLLLDLASGRVVSLFDGTREVSGLRWADAHTLEVGLATDDDGGAYVDGPGEVCRLLVREDWTTVRDGEVTVNELPCDTREFEALDPPAEDLRELARLRAGIAAAGRRRGPVWAVEALRDGGVLATHDSVDAECWNGDGTLRWTLPSATGGRELLPAPNGESVWVNGTTRTVWGFDGWEAHPNPVTRISVRDGATLDTLDPGFAVAATARTDGWLALRDCRTRVEQPQTVLVAPEQLDVRGDTIRVAVGEYNLFAHHFPLRRAPDLLFLRGDGVQGTVDKRVVAVDPPTAAGEPATVRDLFALEWNDDRDRALSGGPAVHLTDPHGHALVHTGAVGHTHGPRDGGGFVVRRTLPGGEPAWVFTADAAPTAVDADDTTVYVAFTSGEIVALDAGDGTVRARRRLHLDGHPADPLSLAVVAPGRLLVGTVDGRIAECGS